MHTRESVAEPRGTPSRPRRRRWLLPATALLSAAALLAAVPRNLPAQAPPGAQLPPTPTYTPQSPGQLQQLVAPIALYPDSLVAQVLAASTFPEQVVEADRWLQANPGLTGDSLAQAVNQQPWDASVQALTAFPAVLGNMDRNLSWTSSLGDAYYNQPQDVMAAVQAMRQRAAAAGNLQSNSQAVVSTEGSDVEIEPQDPDVVYVPAYDPWVVYGDPVLAWPGWYEYPGIWFNGPSLSFGVGIPLGIFSGFPWGWSHWGFNWRRHIVLFNHAQYFSHSVTFFNRRTFYAGGGARGAFRSGAARPGSARPGAAQSGGFRASAPGFGAAMPRPFGGDDRAARGYAAPRGQIGVRSGAFSNFSPGGETRGFAARGRSSFGGGGSGGGGFRGGGGGGAPRGGGGGRGR